MSLRRMLIAAAGLVACCGIFMAQAVVQQIAPFATSLVSDAYAEDAPEGGAKQCSGEKKCGGEKSCSGEKKCEGEKKCGGEKSCGGESGDGEEAGDDEAGEGE